MVVSAKSKKTLKIIGNVVFWLVLALVVLYSMVSLLSSQESNKITFFGIESLSVESNSMEPTFKEGDLIFITTNFDLDEIEVGDVITYRDVQGSYQHNNISRLPYGYQLSTDTFCPDNDGCKRMADRKSQ